MLKVANELKLPLTHRRFIFMVNYFPQQPYNRYPMYNQSNGFRIIPVGSETEINSIAEDYSGVPAYFHNRSTNEIILKQFDMKTGITNIQKYIKSDAPNCEIIEGKSKIDINTLDEKLNMINDKLSCLDKTLGELTVTESETTDKGGKK